MLTAAVQGRAEEVRARIHARGVNIVIFGEVAHCEDVDVGAEGFGLDVPDDSLATVTVVWFGNTTYRETSS